MTIVTAAGITKGRAGFLIRKFSGYIFQHTDQMLHSVAIYRAALAAGAGRGGSRRAFLVDAKFGKCRRIRNWRFHCVPASFTLLAPAWSGLRQLPACARRFRQFVQFVGEAAIGANPDKTGAIGYVLHRPEFNLQRLRGGDDVIQFGERLCVAHLRFEKIQCLERAGYRR